MEAFDRLLEPTPLELDAEIANASGNVADPYAASYAGEVPVAAAGVTSQYTYLPTSSAVRV